MAGKLQTNNENIQGGVQQLIKNGDSSRKHFVKKQVFGELKNVIHNQGNVEQETLTNKNSSIKCVAPNAKSKPIKGEQKDANVDKANQTRGLSDTINDDINLLDYFDFKGNCCSMSYKSVQEIWSEMNLYDDSFINKLIDDDQMHEGLESACKMSVTVLEDNSEFFGELSEKVNHKYWRDINDIQEDSDIFLYLEKPNIVNFHL